MASPRIIRATHEIEQQLDALQAVRAEKAKYAQAEKDEKTILDSLRLLIGDEACAIVNEGGFEVARQTVSPSTRIDEARLKQEQPAIATEYAKTVFTRRVRFV